MYDFSFIFLFSDHTWASTQSSNQERPLTIRRKRTQLTHRNCGVKSYSRNYLERKENNEKQKETREERLLEAVSNLSLNFNYVLRNKLKFFFSACTRHAIGLYSLSLILNCPSCIWPPHQQLLPVSESLVSISYTQESINWALITPSEPIKFLDCVRQKIDPCHLRSRCMVTLTGNCWNCISLPVARRQLSYIVYSFRGGSKYLQSCSPIQVPTDVSKSHAKKFQLQRRPAQVAKSEKAKAWAAIAVHSRRHSDQNVRLCRYLLPDTFFVTTDDVYVHGDLNAQ